MSLGSPNFVLLLLGVVTGVLLGYGLAISGGAAGGGGNVVGDIAPATQHYVTQSPPNSAPSVASVKSTPKTLPPLTRRPDLIFRKQHEEPDSEDKSPMPVSAASSSSCESFMMHELKTSFLSSLADPDCPVSIIHGGIRRDEEFLSPSSVFASSLSSSAAPRRRSFKQIGDSMKDDKTLLHRFDHLYSSYLDRVRDQSNQLSLFEVGLGCDQSLGIGASARLWGEYLPNARLAMLEFNATCAEEWPKKHKHLAPKGGFVVYSGDQASWKVWKSVLAKEDGSNSKKGSMMYDMIIDDGGHKMDQQIVTFLQMWPRLKPGGVYIIEDMNSSWKSRYGGTKRQSPSSATANNLVKALMDRVHALPVPGHKRKFDEDLTSSSPIFRVDCFHFVCAIVKRF